MEPDPKAAETVRLIFQLAAEGNGSAEISRQLTARYIRALREYKATRETHTHDISRSHGVWVNNTVLNIPENVFLARILFGTLAGGFHLVDQIHVPHGFERSLPQNLPAVFAGVKVPAALALIKSSCGVRVVKFAQKLHQIP